MGGNGRNGILQTITILEERKAMSRYENQSRKKKERKEGGKGKGKREENAGRDLPEAMGGTMVDR